MTPEEFIAYHRDVQEATVAFPEMEVGAAYRKFMLEIKKKEPQPPISSGDPVLKAAKALIRKTFRRPCNRPNCTGTQILAGVCEGCAAGKKGFKSVWECEECLYREYSIKPYLEWYEELKRTHGDN